MMAQGLNNDLSMNVPHAAPSARAARMTRARGDVRKGVKA